MRYVLAAVLLAVASGLAQEKAADDAKRLQGTWVWDPAEKQPEANRNMNRGQEQPTPLFSSGAVTRSDP